MRLLLDTHILIWALASPATLSETGRRLIVDPGNDVFVSVASLWEIAIKRQTGRTDAPRLDSAAALDLAERSGYRILDIAAAHAIAVESLPPLHGDPFDRLLVAQALTEPLRLLTRDRHLAAYSDTVLLV